MSDDQRRRRRPQEEQVPLRPAHPGVPASSSSKITEEMQAKCPMAWTDVYDGHWVAADSKHVFELARCPVVSNDHDINGERQRLPGHHDPEGAAGHGRARRHPGDGRARAQHLPRSAEPVPVPRRDQAVAAVRRRDRARRPRREDRVGPHRLRRRPRQHRARGADAGDDGHRAEEVAGLQRARARCRCPPRSTRPTPRASPR